MRFNLRTYWVKFLIMLFCLCGLLLPLAGCTQDNGDLSNIEIDSTNNSESPEESSYFIEESNNSEQEGSTENSQNTSYLEESSEIDTDDSMVLTEQDAKDFYERIVLSCITEFSFPLFRYGEDIEKDKTTPFAYPYILGVYIRASKSDPSIEIGEREGMQEKISEENINELVEKEILSDQDVALIESQIVGTGYLCRKTDVQNAVDYFYGKDIFDIDNWILQNEDGTQRFYETTNGEWYIRWVAGQDSSSLYYYSLCGIELNGQMGSIDLQCIKMTTADSLWVQDVASEEYYEDLGFDLLSGKDIDVHNNDEMFQMLLEAEEVNESNLGIIRIDFYKDETGVHYKDIHYLSKNVFCYLGEEKLLVYNSPSFDDLKEGLEYTSGHYLTIYNIHDGWGEIHYPPLRYRGDSLWVRMDNLVPREDHIIDYQSSSENENISSEQEEFKDNLSSEIIPQENDDEGSSSGNQEQSESQNQSSSSQSSQESSSQSQSSQQTQESSKPESYPAQQESKTSTCDHEWVDVTTTVHHDAVIEQVWVIDKEAYDEVKVIEEAWDEEIPDSQSTYKCLGCGYETYSEDDIALHTIEEDCNFTVIVKTTTVHHDAVTETVHHDEVGHYEEQVTQAAYDETVVTGQKCSKCGVTK